MSLTRSKVLFIIPTLNPGGIETYLLRFLTYIKDTKQIDVHILVRSYERGVLYDSYKALELSIYFHPLGYINPSRIIWYYRFLMNGKFNTVCDFNANFAGLSLWIAKKANIENRIAFYRQGKDHFAPTTFKELYNSWVKSLVYKNSTQILSNSKAALDYFFPNWRTENRFKVIYNGINVDDFKLDLSNNNIREELKIPFDALVICHSGRLDPAKNHSTILQVAKKLIEVNNNIYFILCGLNTEKLNEVVEKLGITQNIRLLGFRNDVPLILSASNIFYFPSKTEGQPNALIEAMLSGLPFVASSIPPIKEIVPDELHTNLIEPTSIDDSVKQILNLIENLEKGQVDKTRQWASEHFSHSLRFNEFYKCLLSNN